MRQVLLVEIDMPLVDVMLGPGIHQTVNMQYPSISPSVHFSTWKAGEPMTGDVFIHGSKPLGGVLRNQDAESEGSEAMLHGRNGKHGLECGPSAVLSMLYPGCTHYVILCQPGWYMLVRWIVLQLLGRQSSAFDLLSKATAAISSTDIPRQCIICLMCGGYYLHIKRVRS